VFTAWYDWNFKHSWGSFFAFKPLPCLWRSVASLSPRISGFSPRPVHVGFVVDKMALGKVKAEGKVHPRTGTKAQRGGRGIVLHFNFGAR